MNKFTIALLSLVLLLTGCSSNETPKTPDTNNNEPTAKGYVFEVSDLKIAVDENMSPIANTLGEPQSYFEEPSCAAQGIGKIYTYGSYVIETYPDGENDLIACITLKDDSVSTAEGINLSNTKADVIAKYGDNYTQTDTSLSYEKDGMKLYFMLDGDYLAAIEYRSAVLN